MAKYSWQDLERAAADANKVWRLLQRGQWVQTVDDVLVKWTGDEELRDHLNRELLPIHVRTHLDEEGHTVGKTYVWTRWVEHRTDYYVLVPLGVRGERRTEELIVAQELPAYLQLLRQLREAGLIG